MELIINLFVLLILLFMHFLASKLFMFWNFAHWNGCVLHKFKKRRIGLCLLLCVTNILLSIYTKYLISSYSLDSEVYDGMGFLIVGILIPAFWAIYYHVAFRKAKNFFEN